MVSFVNMWSYSMYSYWMRPFYLDFLWFCFRFFVFSLILELPFVEFKNSNDDNNSGKRKRSSGCFVLKRPTAKKFHVHIKCNKLCSFHRNRQHSHAQRTSRIVHCEMPLRLLHYLAEYYYFMFFFFFFHSSIRSICVLIANETS